MAVNAADWDLRCSKCNVFAYHSDWRGRMIEGAYICPSCETGHIPGDLKKEIERLRWEVIRLEQRCKDLEAALLTALAAQKES